MRGLWTKETKELAEKVINGNSGAMRVVDELLWFSDWFEPGYEFISRTVFMWRYELS